MRNWENLSIIRLKTVSYTHLYFSTIVSQVSSLMSLIPTIAKGIESVNSIGEVLLEEDVEHNEGKKKLAGVHGDFCFENVKFHVYKRQSGMHSVTHYCFLSLS